MARTSLRILWLCAKDRVHQEGEVSHLCVLSISCTHEVCRFIGTSDLQSMGNMQRHVRQCWDEDALKKAYDAKTAEGARCTFD